MIEPKEVVIKGRTFIMSKFSFWDGREIVTQFPVSAIPKLGDYKINEELAAKIYQHVGVTIEGLAQPLMLTTKELVANHVKDWETGLRLEAAMMHYNCDFFQDGSLSTFFATLSEKLPVWTTKILTAFQEQSSPTAKRRSKS